MARRLRIRGRKKLFRKRRKMARYKKTAIIIAGAGIALGLAAVILWPQLKKLFQTPLITVGKPTISPGGEIDPEYVDSLPVDGTAAAMMGALLRG